MLAKVDLVNSILELNDDTFKVNNYYSYGTDIDGSTYKFMGETTDIDNIDSGLYGHAILKNKIVYEDNKIYDAGTRCRQPAYILC
jgi:hypothetical protein